jgi:hypothetical protein
MRMPIIFFNAERLALKLFRNEITEKERYYYIAAGYLATFVFSYSGLFLMNARFSALKIYEFFCLFVINATGFYMIYALAKEEKIDRFVSDFVCLSFPVFNTLFTVVWGSFWVINLFFFDKLINIAYNINYQTALYFQKNLFELMIFLSNAIFNAAFFYWIFCLLKKKRIILNEMITSGGGSK